MNLGQPQKNGNGVRFSKMFNRRRWKSPTYKSDTRENRRHAWRLFLEWREQVPGKTKETRLTTIQKLSLEIEQLKSELSGVIENESNFDFIEATQGEIQDIQKDINARTVAEQQGIDIDKERKTKQATISMLGAIESIPETIQDELFHSELTGEPLSEEKTIGYWKKRFIEKERITRKVSPTTWSEITSMTQFFVDWIGEGTPVENINERVIENYMLYLGDKGSKIKKRTRMICFVKYLAAQRLISLPLNLDEIKFETGAPDIKHFPTKELGTILAESEGFLKCALHLMANCGMTQRDIATLTPEMIQDGYIVRKRSKKANVKNATESKWKLWPETQRLIEEYRTDENELLFTVGGRTWYLLETRIDDDGNEKLSKDDKISGQWEAFAKNNSPTLSMKYIRKTSAHYLPTENESMKDMFLNHQPQKLGLKHYYSIDQTKFDLAVMQLRQVYKLDQNKE